MNDYTVIGLFPIPVYVSKLDISIDEKNYIYGNEFTRLKVDNGYISSNKYLLETDELKNLKKQILNHINFFVRDQLKIKNSVEFYLTNSWSMLHKFGDRAPQHFHRNSVFSGIVYLKCSPISGDLIFHKANLHQTLFPETAVPDYEEHNAMNVFSNRWIPEENQIFIFPSHLEHSVTRSEDEDDRYCLAFNVYWRGEFGHYDPEGIDILVLP